MGVVKSSLRKTLGRQRLCRPELETLLHEMEGCVNSRPLTFVGDDFDSGRQLTPSHFLLGRACPQSRVENATSLIESSHDQLVRLFDERSELSNQFWTVWKEEYMRNLSPFKGQTKTDDLRKGCVVLVQGEGPRLDWPLGRVLAIHPSKDGLTRTVLVKTAKGQITRPIQRLLNLEIAAYEPKSAILDLGLEPSETQSVNNKLQSHNTQPSLSFSPSLSSPIPESTEESTEENTEKPVQTTRSGRIRKQKVVTDYDDL